jgi:hypothetical protein
MTIKEFFKHYYDIACNGDLELLDELFHSDSPFLVGVKMQYESVRKQLEINIEIESIELISKLDDILVVRDNIMFEGNKDGKTKKNRSENLHVLTKRQDGEWKLQVTTCLANSGA